MDGQVYRQFFLQPTDTWHRRYEALRSAFVEGQSLSGVADRFGVSYGTVCNWVSEFRGQYDRGQPPPFSLNCAVGVLRAEASRSVRRSKLPTSKLCRWSRGGDYTHVRQACSCFGLCSPDYGSTAS
jgi:hypothetical protein